MQKAPSYMFGKIQSLLLKAVTTSRNKLHLRRLKAFEFAFVAINYFRKTVGNFFTKFD